MCYVINYHSYKYAIITVLLYINYHIVYNIYHVLYYTVLTDYTKSCSIPEYFSVVTACFPIDLFINQYASEHD